MSSSGNPLKNIINELQLGECLYGTMVAKANSLALPQTGTSTLFTIQGGAVLVTGLFGVVTTAIQNQACNLSIGLAPTVGSAATAGIGGPSSVQNLLAGNVIAAPAVAGAGGTALAAPAVPLTGVNVQNNYNGTVDVTLSAGTLTGVNVNGVAVGSTPWSPATYPVPAHGQIAWVGSVAPTWTWTGSVALEINANGSLSLPKDVGFVASPGLITLTTSASSTGAIRWYCSYVPIDGNTTKSARVS
jgi:hypothetical protein